MLALWVHWTFFGCVNATQKTAGGFLKASDVPRWCWDFFSLCKIVFKISVTVPYAAKGRELVKGPGK